MDKGETWVLIYLHIDCVSDIVPTMEIKRACARLMRTEERKRRWTVCIGVTNDSKKKLYSLCKLHNQKVNFLLNPFQLNIFLNKKHFSPSHSLLRTLLTAAVDLQR